MLSVPYKYLLFIASFSPVWIIVSISHILDNHDQLYSQIGVVISLIIVAISVILTTEKFASLRNSSNAKTLTVDTSQEIKVEYIPYIVSCLVPLLIVIHGPGSLFAVIATMVIIGIFYVKTRMILTNPIIILAGYRMYEIVDKQYTRPITVISKSRPERDQRIRVRDVYDNLCIEQKVQI